MNGGMVNKRGLLCEPFSLCIFFRDSLLASLLDGVRASGNRDVCVKMKPTKRGKWSLIVYKREIKKGHVIFAVVSCAY